jgi:hypothetical protein
MKHFHFHFCQRVEMRFYKEHLVDKEDLQMLEILRMKLSHLYLYQQHHQGGKLIPRKKNQSNLI